MRSAAVVWPRRLGAQAWLAIRCPLWKISTVLSGIRTSTSSRIRRRMWNLGRSASGTVARPGFERLVAWLCAREVGAVLCFDASRLARNGRDWHHLLELCGLVEARVIDLDGVYDPCRPNDRLLLGMKGSISEFELGVLRAACSMPPAPKRAVASCASACRSATSGIARSVSASIPTSSSRRWSG